MRKMSICKQNTTQIKQTNAYYEVQTTYEKGTIYNLKCAMTEVCRRACVAMSCVLF